MRKSLRDKQNIILLSQPRLSLKNAQNSRKKLQITQGRLSMLPLKKQRASVAIQTPLQQNHTNSVLRNNINILNSSAVNMSPMINTCRRSIRKQAIINNLVHKLDEQEQIRSIIQTKLRRNSYGTNNQILYTSQFQPYYPNNNYMSSTQKSNGKQNNFVTLGNQNNNQTNLSIKLQKCQEQLKHFKQVIEIMSIKMKKMQKQAHNKNQNDDHDWRMQDKATCRKCKCNKNQKDIKKMKQTSTQTHFDNQNVHHDKNQKIDLDFLQNLDKTLKVLNSNKKIR